MKKLIIVFSFITLFGCKKDMSKEKANTYEVVSVLYNYVTKKKMNYFAFPPSPPNPNVSLDSIYKTTELYRLIPKDTNKIVNGLLKKRGRLIIAIDSVLHPHNMNNVKKENLKCITKKYEDLYSSFINLKEFKSIDVSKIKDNRYSVILPYQYHYKSSSRRGHEKYNIILKFSRISFNKEKTKAIVIMGASFGRLNSFSSIYFLEMENGKWKIRCEDGLSIS